MGVRSDHSVCDCGLSRRGFFAGLAGAAGSLSGAGLGQSAPPPKRKRGIIDVHAHYMPPALKAAGTSSAVMSGWTLEKHLEAMDEGDVDRSVLSVTTPGVVAPGESGRSLVRACNDYGAKLVSDRPARFGLFTYVRPDDTDHALAEIAYGFDQLKANGVGLFTSYNNKWLGDPVFDPIFDELERRRATVYVHPTSSPCCRALLPGIADTLVEYGTDTSRAIASYVYRGRAQKYPNVKMIWSHSGGTMPYLIERFDFADRNDASKAAGPGGFRNAASQFFYDVAQASNPVSTGALRKVVPPSHILFGTDYPFRTPAEHVKQLEAGGVFNRKELADLYAGNVARDLAGLLA